MKQIEKQVARVKDSNERIAFREDDPSVAIIDYERNTHEGDETQKSVHEEIFGQLTDTEKHFFQKAILQAESRIGLLFQGSGLTVDELSISHVYLSRLDNAGLHGLNENQVRNIEVSIPEDIEKDFDEFVSTIVHEKIHNLSQSQIMIQENGVLTRTTGLTITQSVPERNYSIFSSDIQDLKQAIETSDFQSTSSDIFSELSDIGLTYSENQLNKLSSKIGLDPYLARFLCNSIIKEKIHSLEDLKQWVEELDTSLDTQKIESFIIRQEGKYLDEATVEFLSRYTNILVGMKDTEALSKFTYGQYTEVWVNSYIIMLDEDREEFVEILKMAVLNSDPGIIIEYFKDHFEISIAIDDLKDMKLPELYLDILASYNNEQNIHQRARKEEQRIEEIRKSLSG
jgi:hypothetical protein